MLPAAATSTNGEGEEDGGSTPNGGGGSVSVGAIVGGIIAGIIITLLLLLGVLPHCALLAGEFIPPFPTATPPPPPAQLRSALPLCCWSHVGPHRKPAHTCQLGFGVLGLQNHTARGL